MTNENNRYTDVYTPVDLGDAYVEAARERDQIEYQNMQLRGQIVELQQELVLERSSTRLYKAFCILLGIAVVVLVAYMVFA